MKPSSSPDFEISGFQAVERRDQDLGRVATPEIAEMAEAVRPGCEHVGACLHDIACLA